MFRILFFLFIIFLNQTNSQPFTVSWQSRFDGVKVPSQSYYHTTSCIDINGNFLIAGTRDTGIAGQIFLHRITVNGTLILNSKYFFSLTDYPILEKVYSDINNNIYVAGTLSNDYYCDFFISKFDSTGNHLWNFRQPELYFDRNKEVNLKVDSSGNVYFGYHIHPVTNTHSIMGKLNNSGTLSWQKQINNCRLPSIYLNSNNYFTMVTEQLGMNVIHCDSAGMQISIHNEPALFEGTAYFDESGNAFLYGYSFYPDSSQLIMFNTSLNVLWRTTMDRDVEDPIISCQDGRCYLIAEVHDEKIDCFSYTGLKLWTKTLPVWKYISLQAGNFGRIFITFETLIHTNNFSEIDSSGALLHEDSLNLDFNTIPLINDSLICLFSKTSNDSLFQLNYFTRDSSFLETFNFSLPNFQSRMILQTKF